MIYQITAFLITILFSFYSYSSAWNRKENEIFLLLDYSFERSQNSTNNLKETKEGNYINLYGEYGLSDSLTVIPEMKLLKSEVNRYYNYDDKYKNEYNAKILTLNNYGISLLKSIVKNNKFSINYGVGFNYYKFDENETKLLINNGCNFKFLNSDYFFENFNSLSISTVNHNKYLQIGGKIGNSSKEKSSQFIFSFSKKMPLFENEKSIITDMDIIYIKPLYNNLKLFEKTSFSKIKNFYNYSIFLGVMINY